MPRIKPDPVAVTALIPRDLLRRAREVVMRKDQEIGRLNSRVVVYALEQLTKGAK